MLGILKVRFEAKYKLLLMLSRALSSLLAILLMACIQSCQPTRYVAPETHLLTKSVIHLNENKVDATEVTSEDLILVLKQKPNRKILGHINFHLGVWNYANGKKKQDRKFVKFLKTEIGEAPVIYEPALQEANRKQIEHYMHNHGHFNAKVEVLPWYDSKEVEVHYYVNSGPPYILRKVGYSFENDSLRLEFTDPKDKNLTRSKLQGGTVYNTDKLTQERDRLTQSIKDLGYFSFEKIHILYDVDTNIAGNYFDLMIRFRNQRINEKINGKDSLMTKPHLRHKIARVDINQNYESLRRNMKLDTLIYEPYSFIYLNRPYVRAARLSRNIFLRPEDYYSMSKTQYTYDRINALNNYRFIDIRFEPIESHKNLPELEMKINLNKSKKQAMTLETVGTNRSGNLGIATSVNYKNKNLFRGAEQFDWKVYGGVEWQNTSSTIEGDGSTIINKTPINTYEYGSQITLTIPDFLLRNPNKDLPRIKEPKTNISLAIDKQGRPQYDRNLINTSYQWTMRLRPQDQLTIAPIDISVIQLNKSAEFANQLRQTKNALLINSYKNHIIPAGRITYLNSTQDLSNSMLNYHYYRTSFETAGNLLRLVSKPIGLTEKDGSYLIDTIAFAQYLKFDFEFRKYFILTRTSKSVVRFFYGSGIPLANRAALPFERSFFSGGSNGIRAWQSRGLGPGNVSDTSTYGIDQVGELQLELNLEYRFKIIKQFEGAVFSDFGNIWFFSDPDRPEANFRFDSFWRGIAVAPGVGLRLNLDFFVIRLDAGLQLKDPSLPQGERWSFFQPKTLTNQYRQEWRLNNGDPSLGDWSRPKTTFNIGINYPF